MLLVVVVTILVGLLVVEWLLRRSTSNLVTHTQTHAHILTCKHMHTHHCVTSVILPLCRVGCVCWQRRGPTPLPWDDLIGWSVQPPVLPPSWGLPPPQLHKEGK